MNKNASLMFFLCLLPLSGCHQNIKKERAQAKATAGQYERLAKNISYGHRYLSNKKVAVLPFSYTDNRASEDGVIVAERLLTLITNGRKLEVVERGLLEKVMSELKLQRSGVIDEGSIKGIGKVLGVEAVVTGTLTSRRDGRIDINARLIKTESAAVIAAAAETIMPDWTAGAAKAAAQPRVSGGPVSPLPAPTPMGPCPGEMAAYWKFEDGRGVTARDSVGGNDGKLLAGPVYAPGRAGNALSFDGIDDMVSVPSSNALNGPGRTGRITLEGWFYVNDLAALRGDCANAPAKYDKTALDYGLFICNNPGFKVRFHLGGEHLDHNVRHPENTWVHYAATYDGAAMRIYKNGREETRRYGTFAIPSSGANLIFGAHGVSHHHFSGLMDEVAVFSRALSAGEISDHYLKGLSGKGYCVPLSIDTGEGK